LTVSAAFGQEKDKETRVKMKDLPAAVHKTVQQESKGAVVKGVTKEVEDGKTQYELETMVHGHSRDLIIDEAGNVTEVEEQVRMESLPAEVKAGLKQAAGKGKIMKVETVSKGGTLTMYEAVVQHGTKKSEIQIGTDGKPVPKKQ
jgi:hypothetical protein